MTPVPLRTYQQGIWTAEQRRVIARLARNKMSLRQARRFFGVAELWAVGR